jgi:hypothetical protein
MFYSCISNEQNCPTPSAITIYATRLKSPITSLLITSLILMQHNHKTLKVNDVKVITMHANGEGKQRYLLQEALPIYE